MQVEVCNTHLRFSTETLAKPVEAGIDTWRVVRYLDSDRELDQACDRVGPAGLLPEKVAGHQVGVLPRYRMLWAEGHPAVDALAPPTGLHQAERKLLDALGDAGLPLGREGGIGRLDQTVTVRFQDGREGLAFLAGLAAVDLPRLKTWRIGRPDRPESVSWSGQRSAKKVARVYDKGVEAGIAPPGELIRLENQTRFRKEARMSSEVMSEHRIAEVLFRRRFAPIAESCQGVTAATLPILADRIAEKVAEGEMTAREAERLAGFLLLEDRRVGMSRATRWRRRRELRRHGLVLADPLSDPVEVDLGEALDAALSAWAGDDG